MTAFCASSAEDKNFRTIYASKSYMEKKENKAPVIEVTFSPNNTVSKDNVEEVEFVLIDDDEQKEEG